MNEPTATNPDDDESFDSSFLKRLRLPDAIPGGPPVDSQAIAELALYMHAQAVDCSESIKEAAATISREAADETWQLVSEFLEWRMAYSEESRRLFESE